MSSSGGAYLLLGPENGEKRQFIESIAARLSKGDESQLEIHRIYPHDTDIREVVSLLRNGSLFSPHRLVILSNADEVKGKADISLIAEYCAKPNDQTTLIMTADSISVEKGLEKGIPKDRKKIFWEMFENQKKSWLFAFFKKRNIVLTPEAADLLLDLVENNTEAMAVECERLSSFLGPGSEVTEDDVERLIYHSKGESVFTLFEAVSRADFQWSLDILVAITLSGQSNGVQILSGLLWQFRKLRAFAVLVSSSYPHQEAFAKLNIRGKRNQALYVSAVKIYTTTDLERIVSLTAQYDNWLRSVRADMENTLIQLFLYDCIVKRGNGIFREHGRKAVVI